MGSKTSRQQHIPHQFSSSKDENSYPINVRAYATWDHRVALTSNDVLRSATQEIQNLKTHNQITSSTTSQISPQQDKVVSSSSSNNFIERKKPRHHQNIEKVKLGVRKSQSMDNLPIPNHFITAQQLLYDQDKRRRKNKSSSSQMSTQSYQSSNIEKSTSSSTISQISAAKVKRKKVPDDFKFVSINPKDLQNAREIGKGNFGTVYHAIYKGTRDVAIKHLHSQDKNVSKAPSADYDESMRELLYEAHIMTRLKHANLLRIIGVTFFGDKQQLSLVTDFMKNGSLLDYLRKNREIFLTSDSKMITMKLNSFARQIFEAMLYLEERKIIHRDLAARNCLIGDSDTLKVGDFGLTTLTECGLYKGTYRSVCAPRWSSPEAVFSSKYSSRSDVWSYGITLWEVYSLGERPFGNMTNFAVQIVLKNSSENLSRHLPQPRQFASDETYTHIILPCLTYNVAMRPRFKDLRERLVTILVYRS